MPVTFGDLSTLRTPLSVMRVCALLCSCLSFSLASSMKSSSSSSSYMGTFHTFCMVVWGLFFTITFLIIAINFTQFHTLLPLSWKNLTATVASLGALMSGAATFAFPWIDNKVTDPKVITVMTGSFFAMMAYVTELQLIRTQDGEQQRGYMASVPGMLKALQVFGSCVALVLLAARPPSPTWLMAVSVGIYAVCLLGSLAMVLVMVGDCAARCPVPFERLLTGFSLLGMVAYMAATVLCCSRNLQAGADLGTLPLRTEATVACITLLAYTVDLAFSVKLLCDRS